MEYTKDLESGSSPKIRKAAEIIFKKKLEGYSSYLIDALVKEIEKPKAWKTQCQLIKAIAASNCTDALPTLKKLVEREYDSTILYKELGFAIFILENTGALNLEFLYQSIEKGNELQICGACSGILFKKVIPPSDDIKKIIAEIARYTENEGPKITPRCYIAAVAHLWPKEETTDFLQSCQKSTWSGLVEISNNALQGKESKIQLI
jgi:hypothetical protein